MPRPRETFERHDVYSPAPVDHEVIYSSVGLHCRIERVPVAAVAILSNQLSLPEDVVTVGLGQLGKIRTRHPSGVVLYFDDRTGGFGNQS